MTPAFELHYTDHDATANQRAAAYAAKRIAANRANSQHSTGPRTSEGKVRSAQNSLSHGLTALSPLLPNEDRAAFDRHVQEIVDEYQPATPTEKQLTRDLAETAWRLNRIPALEAQLLSIVVAAAVPGAIDLGATNLDAPGLDTALAITEALRRQERFLANLSTQGNRLSRQFHKTLEQLRHLQSTRRQQELRDMRECAAVFQVHKQKGIPYAPATDGFVFSNQEIQSFIDKQMRHGQAKSMEYLLHYAPEKLLTATAGR
jgi:hypothetical protein